MAASGVAGGKRGSSRLRGAIARGASIQRRPWFNASTESARASSFFGSKTREEGGGEGRKRRRLVNTGEPSNRRISTVDSALTLFFRRGGGVGGMSALSDAFNRGFATTLSSVDVSLILILLLWFSMEVLSTLEETLLFPADTEDEEVETLIHLLLLVLFSDPLSVFMPRSH